MQNTIMLEVQFRLYKVVNDTDECNVKLMEDFIQKNYEK